jgi:hypothetical protein
MSPIGGVVSISRCRTRLPRQTASPGRFATARYPTPISGPSRRGGPCPCALLQLTIQRRIINRVLESQRRLQPPLFFRLFGIFPVLRRILARLVGVGIRPEHVRTPEAAA